jgi:23S rRNA (uracil1939-C5)-methyltransferase
MPACSKSSRRAPPGVEPVCRHFGICDGCALQHLSPEAYLAWKREQVDAALKSRDLDVEIEPVRAVSRESRRRASLALGRGRNGFALGYRRGRSHELIDIEVCPVPRRASSSACKD